MVQKNNPNPCGRSNLLRESESWFNPHFGLSYTYSARKNPSIPSPIIIFNYVPYIHYMHPYTPHIYRKYHNGPPYIERATYHSNSIWCFLIHTRLGHEINEYGPCTFFFSYLTTATGNNALHYMYSICLIQKTLKF